MITKEQVNERLEQLIEEDVEQIVAKIDEAILLQWQPGATVLVRLNRKYRKDSLNRVVEAYQAFHWKVNVREAIDNDLPYFALA